MKNKKAFTLIELLAVIVILGVLLSIAIPQVSQYITNSKKEGFVSGAKLFIDSLRNDTTVNLYTFPSRKNDVTIITLDLATMQKSKEKSSFGGRWIYSKSYVAIINVGTGENPDYRYYIAAQDSKDYAMPLTEESELSPNLIVARAKNKMEVTIQSLCGTRDGYHRQYATISGLDKVQPTDGNGNKMSWNAIIYSGDGCSAQE